MSFDSSWSNLAKVVYLRTYSRRDSGYRENFSETVDRVIRGNIRGFNVPDEEVKRLHYYLSNRKAGPAGRGWWFSGAPTHALIGSAATANCWFVTLDNLENFVHAQDLLMLGGGVGFSCEHRFVSKLPRVKKDVHVLHKATKDADFIVPDSREGWNELTRRVLEAYFVTGRSFSFSTVCVRPAGEIIKGFGGIAGGTQPLIEFVEDLTKILSARAGRKLRPVDAADLMCAIGEMVVSGNTRRSAMLALGDPWDKDFLRAKRWDLGTLPRYRARANWSVVCDDVDDLHPLYWKTYEAGEAFGIVNRTTIQTFGRLGEPKPDTAIGVNPCGEATLENLESCNLQSIALPNLSGPEEFYEAARLMHRYGKRVAAGKWHIPEAQEVVRRNNRVGTSLTGCLNSSLLTKEHLDRAYEIIQQENVSYSKELGIAPSIRTTTMNPSGTLGKFFDMHGYEGVHAPFSRYIIQRVRFSASDPLIPYLEAAGHPMEPERRLDGTLDLGTLVVDFYEASEGSRASDDGTWDMESQLDFVKFIQRHWADQAVSATVYYSRKEIDKVKDWLRANIQEIKTVSFLEQVEHGYHQAPKEAISRKQYEELSAKIKPVDLDNFGRESIDSSDSLLSSMECAGGACPVR